VNVTTDFPLREPLCAGPALCQCGPAFLCCAEPARYLPPGRARFHSEPVRSL